MRCGARDRSTFEVRRSAFEVRRSCVRAFGVLAFVSVVSGFSRTVSAQTIDAAVVYKDNCASCHDAPTGRTPSKDALKDRTPETILNAMTSGTMTMQAMQLSTAERRAVAEYLSGKPFGTRQRVRRRAVRHQAAGDREHRVEAAVERLRRRLVELALSARSRA